MAAADRTAPIVPNTKTRSLTELGVEPVELVVKPIETIFEPVHPQFESAYVPLGGDIIRVAMGSRPIMALASGSPRTSRSRA